jgi:hypothetical protein
MCPRACAGRMHAGGAGAPNAQEEAGDNAGDEQEHKDNDTVLKRPDDKQGEQLGGWDTPEGDGYLAGFQWSTLNRAQQDAFRHQYAKASNCGGLGGDPVFDACSYGQADAAGGIGKDADNPQAECVMIQHTERLRFPYLCLACDSGLVDAP